MGHSEQNLRALLFGWMDRGRVLGSDRADFPFSSRIFYQEAAQLETSHKGLGFHAPNYSIQSPFGN